MHGPHNLHKMYSNTLPTGCRGSCDNVSTSMVSQDTALMQQLLLEQQKQQTLLLNQQELLMGLQEGHKELMEKVQHKEDVNSHTSEREWWIKKLLEQSSIPTVHVLHKANGLRSQSFPNLGNSSQQCSFNNNAIDMHSQTLSKEKRFVNNDPSFKKANGEEIILESLSSQASITVEASADVNPIHSPTYQSCGTNTHNLVDAGVNTAPLTMDICVGTEWPSSSTSSSGDDSEPEDSKVQASSQTVGSSDTSPQGKGEQSSISTEKESQNENSVDTPSQPQASTTTNTNSSEHPEIVINQEVLARSVDGYYYWGVVLQHDQQQDSYIIEDLDSRQQLRMARSDFITETQDAARSVLQLYDRALAPRVLSPNCFLPGRCVP